MEKVLVVAVLLLTIKWSISRAAVVEGKKEIIHNTLKFKIHCYLPNTTPQNNLS